MKSKNLFYCSTLLLLSVILLLIFKPYIEKLMLRDSISQKEILRLRSIDRKVDAVLLEVNGGATTPFLYSIYLLPANEQADYHGKKKPVFQASKLLEPNIYWAKNKLLMIEYKQALIHSYCNTKRPLAPEEIDYVVEIREASTASSL